MKSTVLDQTGRDRFHAHPEPWPPLLEGVQDHKNQTMKKKTTTNTKSESKSKIKMVPLKAKTTNSKAATTTKNKGKKSPGVKKKSKQLTDEEYLASRMAFIKRATEYGIELEAKVLRYEAEKKKREIQEFKNRCASLDYCFSPSEGRLIDYYLRNKNSDKEIAYSPIEEVDVYANHLQTLIDHFLRTPAGYYFTRCCLNEIQSATDIQGHWTFGEKEDVLNQGKKVGVKQAFEYCEEDHSTGFKIIEYQLDPSPADQEAWFICKLLDGESCLVGQN